MLKFPSNAMPWPLEQFLRTVRQSPGQAMHMPLQLKGGGGLGGAVSAVQVLATWARLHPGPRELQLQEAFAAADATRTRFASTLPGMAALYLSDRVVAGDRVIDRFEALRAVTPRVVAMQKGEFQDSLRGIGVALVCFSGAKGEYLAPLYARPAQGGVREQSDFRVLIPRLLNQLGNGIVDRLNEGQLDLLSALLHQLFLNTDEHGSFDAVGRKYTTSMRGITARLTTLDSVGSLVANAGDDPAMRAHLSKLALLPPLEGGPGLAKKADGAPIRLVELSVFDTGPGMGLRWLAEHKGCRSYADFSEAEELTAIETCFEKHATTKASQTSGIGLTMAIMAMRRLKAYMTLRTGRIALYQDFSLPETSSFAPKPRFPRRRLGEMAGTSYSIWFRVN